MCLLHFNKITKVYNKNTLTETPVLQDASVTINKGDLVVISGESGSGKSTFLNITGLLDREFEGEYFVNDQKVGELSNSRLAALRNEMFGTVFQEYILVEDSSAYENIIIPLYYSKKFKRNERRDRILEIAQILKIENILKKRVSLLSGGQRQRVAIARALVNDPHVLLMDEPTSALNPEMAQDILKFIGEFGQKHNKTIVIVAHEPQNIPNAFKKKYVLADCKILS